MRRALIVIDVQGEMLAMRDAGYAWANPKAQTTIAAVLAAFRAKGLPVVHVHHHELEPGAAMAPGSPGAAALPCALPTEDEPVFIKTGSSAFIGTGLEAHLRAENLTDLVIIGGEANMCVESSTRMATNLGFSAVVVEDALINFQRSLRDGTVMPAETVLAMTLANLNGGFARILTCDEVVQELTP